MGRRWTVCRVVVFVVGGLVLACGCSSGGGSSGGAADSEATATTATVAPGTPARTWAVAVSIGGPAEQAKAKADAIAVRAKEAGYAAAYVRPGPVAQCNPADPAQACGSGQAGFLVVLQELGQRAKPAALEQLQADAAWARTENEKALELARKRGFTVSEALTVGPVVMVIDGA